MSVKPLRSTYQLKVTLLNIEPLIWRRLHLPNDLFLEDVHYILQDAMGWQNCHLHQFISDKRFFGMVDDDMGMDLNTEDETEYRLCQLLKNEKDAMVYEYDFGNGWEHKIVLEKILPYTAKAPIAQCIQGERACPPEDCGGSWRYPHLLSILQDPAHDEHEEMLAWVGEAFDPDVYDIENTNALLAEGFCKNRTEDNAVDVVH
ncbi:MAG: plasmid pRiA4b ORF-3 family protein [Proteobacteria bacterium]|nr:plasmid pRiA4b ORF-3 family protein [Pseudomonadota bacterium]